jgi:hypothetical protein
MALVEPADQTVKQGESGRVPIAVTRESFTGPVEIRFENLPRGVSVAESDTVIPAGDNLRSFTLVAAADAAPVKNHQVIVRATGSTDLRSTEVFELTVAAR